MDDAAGGERVPALVDAALVDGEEGDEPGGLEGEDGGDGHGAREAERLQAGQNLKGMAALLFCYPSLLSNPICHFVRNIPLTMVSTWRSFSLSDQCS